MFYSQKFVCDVEYDSDLETWYDNNLETFNILPMIHISMYTVWCNKLPFTENNGMFYVIAFWECIFDMCE